VSQGNICHFVAVTIPEESGWANFASFKKHRYLNGFVNFGHSNSSGISD
jgi:hypothetical protein